jgi:hypothetical protein
MASWLVERQRACADDVAQAYFELTEFAPGLSEI